MRKGQITIKDIAKKLNISTSTVSRALRGMADVNADTKKQVSKLASEWNYEPNTIALSLVTNRTNTVGIVIPGFIIHFYASAISGIQEVLSGSGFNVMISQSNENFETEKSNVQAFLSSRVDGMICSLSRETTNLDHFKAVQKKGIPLILFNRVSNELNVSKVQVDDYGGAKEAVEHLIGQNYKRIAHIVGPKNLQISKNRLAGYLDALKKHSIPLDEQIIIECNFTMESGIECTKSLLDLSNPPDAIFAVCDAAAFGAIQVIKSRGLKIPQDIAVVGFTNEPLANLIEPTLTTVSQPTFEIGQTAARLFLEQINIEPEDRLPETRVLKTELIVRGSSVKTN